jgi:predicted enzyme related to lactoylglutathione lyase
MFKTDTDCFDPSYCDCMINPAVNELDSLLQQAASQGAAPVHTSDEINGKFAHLLDPEGVELKLWEPQVRA